MVQVMPILSLLMVDSGSKFLPVERSCGLNISDADFLIKPLDGEFGIEISWWRQKELWGEYRF